MLSRITRGFGSIYTSLKNLVAQHKEQFNPFVTFLIVFVNLALFFKGVSFPIDFFALKENPWQLLLYQFSHGSLEHVMGNCMFLAFVGPSVEKHLGHVRFTLIYLLSGIFSALGYGLLNPFGGLVGASGAIAGIMAIYPFCQKTLYGKILNGLTISFYFVQNFLIAQMQFLGVVGPTVACLAHVAGGVAGIVFYSLLRPTDKETVKVYKLSRGPCPNF